MHFEITGELFHVETIARGYECLPDSEAAGRRMLRVIDESGEDYLYSEDLFVAAPLPEAVRRAVLKAA